MQIKLRINIIRQASILLRELADTTDNIHRLNFHTTRASINGLYQSMLRLLMDYKVAAAHKGRKCHVVRRRQSGKVYKIFLLLENDQAYVKNE